MLEGADLPPPYRQGEYLKLHIIALTSNLNLKLFVVQVCFVLIVFEFSLMKRMGSQTKGDVRVSFPPFSWGNGWNYFVVFNSSHSSMGCLANQRRLCPSWKWREPEHEPMEEWLELFCWLLGKIVPAIPSWKWRKTDSNIPLCLFLSLFFVILLFPKLISIWQNFSFLIAMSSLRGGDVTKCVSVSVSFWFGLFEAYNVLQGCLTRFSGCLKPVQRVL